MEEPSVQHPAIRQAPDDLVSQETKDSLDPGSRIEQAVSISASKAQTWRCSGSMSRHNINIQDGFLFQSLKEARLMTFELVTGKTSRQAQALRSIRRGGGHGQGGAARLQARHCHHRRRGSGRQVLSRLRKRIRLCLRRRSSRRARPSHSFSRPAARRHPSPPRVQSLPAEQLTWIVDPFSGFPLEADEARKARRALGATTSFVVVRRQRPLRAEL